MAVPIQISEIPFVFEVIALEGPDIWPSDWPPDKNRAGSKVPLKLWIRMSRMRHSRAVRAAIMAALLLSYLPTTPSAQVDSSLCTALLWPSIGPDRGGHPQR